MIWAARSEYTARHTRWLWRCKEDFWGLFKSQIIEAVPSLSSGNCGRVGYRIGILLVSCGKNLDVQRSTLMSCRKRRRVRLMELRSSWDVSRIRRKTAFYGKIRTHHWNSVEAWCHGMQISWTVRRNRRIFNTLGVYARDNIVTEHFTHSIADLVRYFVEIYGFWRPSLTAWVVSPN